MSRRLYVGRLPYDCRARDLERLCDEFGDIRDIDMHNGYAFVEFYEYRDADDAVYYLDNTRFMGERIVVEPSRERRSPPRRSDYRIVVENLASTVTWQDLKSFFRPCGEITFADVDRYREEGIVEFAHYNDFKYALNEYHGRKLDGRRIGVYDDRPRGSSRRRSPSRSRSRSRSRTLADRRSRSRSRSVSRTRRDRSRSAMPAEKRERRESSITDNRSSTNDSGNEGSPASTRDDSENSVSKGDKSRADVAEDEGVQGSRAQQVSVAAH